MEPAEIQKIFDTHWKPGFGSIAVDEVAFIQELVRKERPRHFLELGTASGISGGILAILMEENGGESFTTLDRSDMFFGDPTKENGYLIGEIYQGTPVEVSTRLFTTALDLADLGREYDMVFIDANHQHPYPTLDSLCVFPYLSGARTVLHHDLKLYKTQDVPFGIGPKYFYDQVPQELRFRAEANHGNLYSVQMTMSREDLEELAVEALLLPWTIRSRMPPDQLEKTRTVLDAHYARRVGDAFELAASRYNRPFGKTGQRKSKASPPQPAAPPEEPSRRSLLRRLRR